MLDDKTKNQIKKLHSQWQQQANKSKALNKNSSPSQARKLIRCTLPWI